MAFAVIIGGLGTIEGPILGALVYMVLQQELQSYNAWYLIVLGLVAIAIALFARRGLWGLVDDHLHIRLFPVGYWLWEPESSGRRGLRGPGRRGTGGRGRRGPSQLEHGPAKAGRISGSQHDTSRLNGRQPVRRPRSGLSGRQVLWASVPIWSIGFLSFVPFLAYAIGRGGKPELGGVRAPTWRRPRLCSSRWVRRGRAAAGAPRSAATSSRWPGAPRCMRRCCSGPEAMCPRVAGRRRP